MVVLLTDSFNDRPDLADPNYPKYLSYYTLKGLTVYPKTPENRDYERLLRTLTAKGCLHQYGVGVGIAGDGRPIERLPVGPGQGDSDAAATTQAPTITAPTSTGGRGSLLPLILGAVLAALLLGLLLWFLTRRKPYPLRLKLGDRGLPRDFRLLPGTRLALGGTAGMASGSADTFPLAGVAAPVAFIQAERGGATLTPATDGDGPSPALFHNGVALKQPAPLRVGDDLRVAIPASALGGGARAPHPRGGPARAGVLILPRLTSSPPLPRREGVQNGLVQVEVSSNLRSRPLHKSWRPLPHPEPLSETLPSEGGVANL